MGAGGTFVRIAAILVAAAISGAVPAVAATGTCEQLEARLASVHEIPRTTRASRFDQAIERQRAELSRAHHDARRARCRTRGSSALCTSLNAQIGHMESNLATLQRQRGVRATREDTAQERQRILAMIDSRGCREQRQASRQKRPDASRQVQPKPEKRPVVKVTTSRKPERKLAVRGPAADDPNHIVLPNKAVMASPHGAYRTLCVRRCDGYYFPISYAVAPDQFPADERSCAMRCPGAQVELYFHRVPGEESEDMVSAVTGQPYTQLPNAFLYRKAGSKPQNACGCQAASRQKGYSIVAGISPTEDMPAGEENGSIVTLPLPDSEIAITPPAMRPADSAPAPEPAATTQETTSREPASTDSPSGDRTIRVVGPRFFPDPSEAVDLQAPARIHGR